MVRLRRRRRPTRGLLSTLLLGNLPPGMQFALESRAHTVFVVVTIAALIGTGIISIRWEEAGPEVELHRDRARQIGNQVVDRFRDSRAPIGIDSEWLEDWEDDWTADYRNTADADPRPGVLLRPPPEWRPPSIARGTSIAER